MFRSLIQRKTTPHVLRHEAIESLKKAYLDPELSRENLHDKWYEIKAQAHEPSAALLLCLSVGRLLAAPGVLPERYLKSRFSDARQYSDYSPELLEEYVTLLTTALALRKSLTKPCYLEYHQYEHALATLPDELRRTLLRSAA